MEYVDILDDAGNVTGEVISKQEAHRTGKWHRSVHIWIISEDKKRILLQKRCPDKKLFANLWDISVGGHVSSGEETLVSAKREVLEELGLEFNDELYEYVDVFKEKFIDGDIISNEFATVYKIVKDVNLEDITLQKEEVSEARWFTKSELANLRNTDKVIPHIEEFDVILSLLED